MQQLADAHAHMAVFAKTMSCRARLSGVSLGVARGWCCWTSCLPCCCSSACRRLSEGVEPAESVAMSAVDGLPSGACTEHWLQKNPQASRGPAWVVDSTQQSEGHSLEPASLRQGHGLLDGINAVATSTQQAGKHSFPACACKCGAADHACLPCRMSRAPCTCRAPAASSAPAPEGASPEPAILTIFVTPLACREMSTAFTSCQASTPVKYCERSLLSVFSGVHEDPCWASGTARQHHVAMMQGGPRWRF